MRTTVTLEPDILEDLMRFTSARTKTEAVNRAVSEWVRRQRIQQLKSLRGQIHFEGDPESFRRLEVEEAKRDLGR